MKAISEKETFLVLSRLFNFIFSIEDEFLVESKTTNARLRPIQRAQSVAPFSRYVEKFV